jgi:hypothetical protein
MNTKIATIAVFAALFAGVVLAAAGEEKKATSTWVLMEVDESGDTHVIAAKPSHQPASPCKPYPAGDSERVVVSYSHPATGAECHISHRNPRKEFHDHQNAEGKMRGGFQHHKSAQFAVTLHLEASAFHATDLAAGAHTKKQHAVTQLHRNEFHALQTTVSIDKTKVVPSTLQLVGPTAEQKNMVFISSGYTEAEKATFEADVQRIVNLLEASTNSLSISAQPYTRYFSTFNFFQVWYPSTESGASHPSPAGDGTMKNNNLDCSYGATSSRILSCSRTKVNLVGSYAPPDPTSTLYVVLINDAAFGGTGGSGICSVYNGEKMFVVFIHEIGHAAFDLADEYDYGVTESKTVVMKNCHKTNTNTPWNAWILSGILPRPSSICTYSNYYKPTPGTCLMESDQSSMCPVCTESVLGQIYETGMSLAAPRFPSEYETVYVPLGSGVLLYINDKIPYKRDETGSFDVTWKTEAGATITSGDYKIGFDYANNTMPVNATTSAPYTVAGTYKIQVFINDNTNIFLTAERNRLLALTNQTVEQTHWFRIVVYDPADTTTAAPTCTNKTSLYNDGVGSTYCAACDAGQEENCALQLTSVPLTETTEPAAELAGFDDYLFGIGGAFLFLGLVSFFLIWKSLQLQAQNRLHEVMPLSAPVTVVRIVLMVLQCFMLLGSTFAIIFSIYMYALLSIFGRSIILGMITIAAVIWFASFLGFCAAYYKNRQVLFVNFVLLVVLLGCALLFTFLLLYVLMNIDSEQTRIQLHGEWKGSVLDDPVSVCNLQAYLKCSGFNTSCVTITSIDGTSDCPANCEAANKFGYPCFLRVRAFVLDKFLLAAIAGFVVCFFVLVCMVLALVLGCNIKSNKMATWQKRRDRFEAGEAALSQEEIDLLKDEFNKIDTDGSGDISREEFSLFYNQVMGASLNPRQLEDYFDRLDTDQSGTLSFEEFVKVYAPTTTKRKGKGGANPDYDDELDLMLDDKDDGVGIAMNMNELDDNEANTQLAATMSAQQERSMQETMATRKAQDARKKRMALGSHKHDADHVLEDLGPDLAVPEDDLSPIDQNVDIQIDLED